MRRMTADELIGHMRSATQFDLAVAVREHACAVALVKEKERKLREHVAKFVCPHDLTMIWQGDGSVYDNKIMCKDCGAQWNDY